MSTYFSKQKKDVLNKLEDFLDPSKSKVSLQTSTELFNVNEWAAVLASSGNILTMNAVEEAAQQVMDAIGEGTFDPLTPGVRNAVGQRVMLYSNDINLTTKKKLQALLRRSIEAGEQISETADRIKRQFNGFSTWRSKLIARTETYYASNLGTQEAMRQAKVERKQWITSRDIKVRESHQIDGQIVNVDEDFILGDGSSMPWPMDFNERCIHIPTTESKTKPKPRSEVYREFNESNAARRYALERSTKQLASLSEEQKLALNLYKQSGFRIMNAYLRKGEIPYVDPASSYSILSNELKLKRYIDEIVNSSIKLDEGLITWRNADDALAQMGIQDINKLVGTYFQDKGFMSTTLDSKFATNWDETNYIFKIKVPKGSRVNFNEAATYSTGQGESEVLLNAGSKLKVERVTQQTVNSRELKVIECVYE